MTRVTTLQAMLNYLTDDHGTQKRQFSGILRNGLFMIDEELYKLASLELNSDQRRQELWARAVALASDDHDEARYLYTNLRVEEMLNERKNSDTDQSPLSGVEYHPPASPKSLSDEDSLDEFDFSSSTGTPVLDAAPSADLPDLDSASLSLAASGTRLDTMDKSLDTLSENDLTVKLDALPKTTQTTQLKTGDTEGSMHPSVEQAMANSDPLDATEHLPISLDDQPRERTQAQPHNDIAQPPHYAQTASGRVFNVFEHYDGRIKAIKEGVSWPAMFFTLPWLLYRKLWGTAIIYLIMGAVLLSALLITGLQLLDAGPAATPVMKWVFAGFGLLSFIGLLYLPFRHGNNWVARRLERAGYESGPAVSARSAADALLRVGQ